MQNKTNDILAKIFIILSLLIPFINIDVVFGIKYLSKNLVLSDLILDSALWPKLAALSILLLFFSLFLLFKSKSEYHKTNIIRQSIYYAYGIYILLNIVSISQAQFIPLAITTSLKYFVFFSYFLIGTIITSNMKDAYIFISKSFVIFGLFAGLLGVFQMIDSEFNENYFYLISSTFSSKNLYSQILLLTYPFAIFTAITNNNYWKWTAIITALLETFIIIILLSRAVVIGLIISSILIICLLIVYRKYLNISTIVLRKTLSYFLIYSFIIVTAVFLYSKLDTIRPANTQISVQNYTPTGSVKERLMLWEASFKMITDNPIQGVGAGNWGINLRKYTPKEIRNSKNSFYFNFKRAHNDYLQTAAEIGIIGLIAYMLIFLIALFYILIIIKKSKIKNEQLFVFAILFLIISYLIISIFSFPKERISHSITIIMVFICVSIIYFRIKQSDKNQEIKIIKFINLFISLVLILTLFISVKSIKGEIHTRKAYLYKDRNNHSAVIEEIEKANSYFYQMDLSVTPLKWYSATAWFLLNDLNKAQQDYMEAYSIHPYHIHNINDLATTYELKGNHKMSKFYYKQALNLSPQFDESLINLAIVYYNMNEIDSAYHYISKCNTNNTDPKYKVAKEAILLKNSSIN